MSRRRAAYFAARARLTGQTADRVIPAESDWLLPADETPSPTVGD